MLRTTIDPIDIATMSDENMMKVLFSSADYFPGLYRYTLGTLPFPYDNLTVRGLFAAFVKQQQGKNWTRNEWFGEQIKTHSNTMEDGRNYERVDKNLAVNLSQRAFNRFMLPSSFALAALAIGRTVNTLECNKTYMMMGSHIHFTAGAIYVGYDDLTCEYTFKLDVDFTTATKYINSIMSASDISALFQYSSIVAHLNFNGDVGMISSRENILINQEHFNDPVFATPITYDNPLSIKYAKLLGLSDVTRF